MDRLLLKRALALASCAVVLTVAFGCSGRDLRVPPPSYSNEGMIPGPDAGMYPGYEGSMPSGVGSPYQSPGMGSSPELGPGTMSGPDDSASAVGNPYGTASQAYDPGSVSDPYGGASLSSPYGSMGTSGASSMDPGTMPSQFGNYSTPGAGAGPSIPEELPEMAPIPGG